MPDEPRPLVTVVRACSRDGRGGSPTAVLSGTGLGDDRRRAVPALLGTSHAVFVAAGDGDVVVRFYTATGELPACGHGTIAALAYLASRGGRGGYRAALRTAAGVLPGVATRSGGRFEAAFEPGTVTLHGPAPAGGYDAVLDALGADPDALGGGARVAALGRPRLLVPVSTRPALAALTPDPERLRDACDRLGLLGCYVYHVPGDGGRIAARMFAPSIGVAEDIANANSTACLATHLAGRGSAEIAVDMGDAVGVPATITAAVRPGPAGPVVRVGGTATIERVVPLPPRE